MSQGLNMQRPAYRVGPGRQRGISTILILLLVGLAVTVTALIVAYSLRGGQQRQLATHSVTTAQASAWRGVEIVRAVLEQSQVQANFEDWVEGNGWDSESGGAVITVPGSGSAGGQTPVVADGDVVKGYAGGTITVAGLDGIDAVLTSVSLLGTGGYRISAEVTGKAGGSEDFEPLATSKVAVVYEVGVGSPGSEGGSTVCASTPSAPMIFNGDLNISGGSLGVSNIPGNYESIAVNGNLTVGSSSSAKISGCAKGNIDLSGGGITDNGHLYSEATIKINGMSNPSGTTLWGRNVQIGSGVSGGNYTAMKAGAYVASVYSGATLIGTTNVGGSLIASTVSGGLPWVVGTVVPDPGNGQIVITSAGNTFLLDLAEVTINSATGVVSGVTDAAELLSGTAGATLANELTFKTTGIYGGAVSLSTLTVNKLWGYGVTISGWSGSYSTLWASGNIDMVTGTIGTLVGGGDLNATSAGLYWNFPTISNSGRIAGKLTYGSGKATVPSTSSAIPRLQINQANTSPGLPGVPYCDARVQTIVADDYKAAANYVFELKEGVPYLTIQNVKAADGTSLDGSFNLMTTDLRRRPATSGKPFLTCNWQGDPDNGGAHCFRSTTSSSGWNATGVTNFPRGVVWFDGPVTFDGTSSINDADGNRNLLNTIVAKGKVTLTTSGHGQLIAPNYSTPALVCGGAFRPTNLCASSSAFVKWKDSDGVERTGLPIGNVAIVTEGAAQLSGWEIYGNVLLGREMATGGNATTIHGSLTVGANQAGSSTTIQQGGAQIIVPTSTDSQYLPVCTAPTTPTVPATESSSVVRWSRYL